MIRELKRRYKINLALGHALPTYDRAIPLPLSTGNPLYDAALTEKLVTTATLNEPDHLNRAWHLVRHATPADRETLAAHTGTLLNDYKLLLALDAWQRGDEALTHTFLRALPWGWRLAFPTVVIKPAAHLFTGWRRSIRFRLIDDPRFPALHTLFHTLLAQAPGVAILKYRQTVKESAALQHFRFAGEREQAIHDLCFHNGRGLRGEGQSVPPDLEPVGTYLRAREALGVGGVGAMLDVLTGSPTEIPITSYMGLLSSAGVRLKDQGQPKIAALRDYAVRSATAVESLLRLQEWDAWLTSSHAEALSAKVRQGVIEQGRDIPFFKVTKAFLNADLHVRRLVLEPLYIPLLKHFGRQMAGLLQAPAPLTFFQPANVIHSMSFLLYTVIRSATPARLMLLTQDAVDEVAPLNLDEVARHLADDTTAFQRWLLAEFGGLTSHYGYTYHYPAMARTLQSLDPHTPLLLDLPFADSMDLLAALLPFDQVFNLNTAFGAPGEICVAYDYYSTLAFNTPAWSFQVWERWSDKAAQRFAEFLERLHAFQTLAAHVSPGGAL